MSTTFPRQMASQENHIGSSENSLIMIIIINDLGGGLGQYIFYIEMYSNRQEAHEVSFRSL